MDAVSLHNLLRRTQRQQQALHVMSLHLADLWRDASMSHLQLMQSEILGMDDGALVEIAAETAAVEQQHQAVIERINSIQSQPVDVVVTDTAFGAWWPGDDPTQFTVLGVVDGYQYVQQHAHVASGHPAVLRRTVGGPLRRFVPVSVWPSMPEADALAANV